MPLAFDLQCHEDVFTGRQFAIDVVQLYLAGSRNDYRYAEEFSGPAQGVPYRVVRDVRHVSPNDGYDLVHEARFCWSHGFDRKVTGKFQIGILFGIHDGLSDWV